MEELQEIYVGEIFKMNKKDIQLESLETFTNAIFVTLFLLVTIVIVILFVQTFSHIILLLIIILTISDILLLITAIYLLLEEIKTIIKNQEKKNE